ncbi:MULTISPECIES: DUF6011 domain-containing protein [unclassified Streptomyces]|uniref:DUF6011 domain-containing protein n=1 Tax=unclassified Streptomyces TaxID=2593676 RepID=UPI002E27D45E|nr:DUF6011 domain-containing protein [Streptomyces sp. NBC_00223]
MIPDAPLPGLATDEELAAGRRVVRCGMCGRPLTGRDARLRGLGDGCRHKLGGDAAVRRPGRFEVEQDGLPGV